MGNADTKLNFRKAVVQLTSKTQPIEASDDSFWDQFWSESVTNVQDVFALVPGAEIRALREESPNNLATLVYKAVEKLVKTVDSSCRTQREQQIALNCARLLTRVLPYMLEEPEWQSFFWSSLPAAENESVPLAQSLINAVCDLLFCPDFTVASTRRSGPERAEELSSLDSCEYIWAGGVGFARAPPRCAAHEAARTELLRLLLTAFSETVYKPPHQTHHNKWIAYLTSPDNRHALPLFTSLLNTVCSYDPVGLGLPYNHLLFSDTLEPLVEVALQILIVTLDHDTSNAMNEDSDEALPDNLFINYLSRIHRDEDFAFVLRGVTRLLNNPLAQTYLPNSAKRVALHQELLVLFWKMCDYNKKFMYYVLKSSDVLEVLVPILYHLNDSRADQCIRLKTTATDARVGLMHIGVFILLLLSGERNFGVRLNKPYTATVPMDVPVFTGSHADLLVLVFHKIITTGHQRLQPLFDCLLTILVNVSPYLKTLSMVSSSKLLHLLEAFSTPWFLFSAPQHHHLVFFLLEMFNNIIQYQFDGNSNLVYTIIRKRAVFHALANLPHEHTAIARSLQHTHDKLPRSTSAESVAELAMEGSRPAQPAEPGTLNATLPDTPAIAAMTERESAHPSAQQLENTQSLLESRSGGDGEDCEPDAITDGEEMQRPKTHRDSIKSTASIRSPTTEGWRASAEWVASWRGKLPLQTIMRLLQVLVPQVEKICIDKGLTDESEILRFLQHGTLVGLLPVPHPILIRKYQANAGTAAWFRTYMWGVIYIRNVDPPIWYDTDVKLFEIQRV
ncbi:protein HID1 isoform X1 [Leguminivora glycinivorella]|uniref:protein HID1 isoform X1 n=1 Tax=Leguminivora glycinivorella TaxID=1035111 RepID=UPI00200D2C13|nr:protein HID1 isoform X1 [Leguminivora glycinivorella]